MKCIARVAPAMLRDGNNDQRVFVPRHVPSFVATPAVSGMTLCVSLMLRDQSGDAVKAIREVPLSGPLTILIIYFLYLQPCRYKVPCSQIIMLFLNKPLASALVAMITLSIAVSASLDPIEQQLQARDGTAFQQSKAATGKLATPVDLSKAKAPTQAVFKLTGEDLHTNSTVAFFSADESKIAVLGKTFPAVDDKAHCVLGNATANIRRIRYEMTVKLDRDESGDTTVATHKDVKGFVVKATSGLYSNANPSKGSCAKTLARHGEVCANRPYIVPQSLLPTQGTSPASKPNVRVQPQPDPNQEPAYHAGPYVQKRDPLSRANSYVTEDDSDLLFKRDTSGAAQAAANSSGRSYYRTDITASGASGYATTPSGGTICIDTVKRDKKVTKVVPTKAKKAAPSTNSKLHFELVRSEDKKGVWNQIIYNDQNEPIDVTHLALSSNMSFWGAEYYCANCPPGHQKHTILYENVEIEMDEVDEHASPEVQCQGSAQASIVKKQEKSQYADKNKSGIEYKGAIFSIDRVSLGKFDGQGRGGEVSVTTEPAAPEKDSTSAKADGKDDTASQKNQTSEAATKEGRQPNLTPNQPQPQPHVSKRDIVEDDGPIF